jgi:toxin HigB-1
MCIPAIGIIIVARYYCAMILSFADENTRRIFHAEVVLSLPEEIQRVARRKLIYLDEADNIKDLAAPPGNRLHALRGSRAGQHSIRINEQWRVCFLWRPPHAYDVEITDYH